MITVPLTLLALRDIEPDELAFESMLYAAAEVAKEIFVSPLSSVIATGITKENLYPPTFVLI